MSEQEPTVNEQPEMSHEEAMARDHLAANPGDIPSQFGGDVDKFIDSWKEQRAALTRTQQELAELKKAPAPEAAVEEAPASGSPAEGPDSLLIPEQQEADSPAEDAWAAVTAEFVQTGTISDETRAALGVPASVVDGYLAGLQAQQKEQAAKAASAVGGPETLQSIIDWSAKNLTPEERDATNAALAGSGWEYTLLGLKARMEQSQPVNNEPKAGPSISSSTAPAVSAYADQNEMLAAMRDPRYGTDPQYTDFVQNRLRLTYGSR